MERIYQLPGGITVSRMQPAIGAVISGVDLHAGVNGIQAQSLKQALHAHGVLLIPGQQGMTFEDHLSFACLFGKPVEEGPDPDRPMITPVRAKAGSREGTASSWHSDGCYRPEPPIVSILRGIDPCTFGGDTCWSSGVAAYANLPDELKDRIADLRFSSSLAAVMPRNHDSFGSREKWNQLRDLYPTVHWPVVSVHPVTGARALYVNRTWSIDIVGLEGPEGKALIGRLADEFLRPEYQCRWQWSKGDVAIWDNRLVQHYGVPDHTTDRYLERITVSGGPVISIAEWEAQQRSATAPA